MTQKISIMALNNYQPLDSLKPDNLREIADKMVVQNIAKGEAVFRKLQERIGRLHDRRGAVLAEKVDPSRRVYLRGRVGALQSLGPKHITRHRIGAAGNPSVGNEKHPSAYDQRRRAPGGPLLSPPDHMGVGHVTAPVDSHGQHLGAAKAVQR